MTENVESMWDEVIEQLAAKKQQVIAEINAYPPPIPACDQQFNFLLEERTRLTRLVREAKRLATESPAQITAFLESVPDVELTGRVGR